MEPSHRRHILKAVSAFLEHNGEYLKQFKVVIELPGCVICLEPQEDELAVGALPEAQQHILNQFEIGQVLTTDQIAKLTGYANGGRFRKHISDLQTLGFLEKSGPGYKRVPGGGNIDPEKSGTNVSSTGNNPDD